MKTILVPTDYQPASFDCIPAVCQQLQGHELTLVFMHMFKLSDSINELLLLNRRNREYEKVSDEFYKRFRDIRAQFPQIKNIRIEFLYGSTLNLLRNFLEANEIDMILDTNYCSFSPIHKRSINPQVLVLKCGLPILTLSKTNTRVQQPAAQAVVYHEELLTEV